MWDSQPTSFILLLELRRPSLFEVYDDDTSRAFVYWARRNYEKCLAGTGDSFEIEIVENLGFVRKNWSYRNSWKKCLPKFWKFNESDPHSLPTNNLTCLQI